MSSRPAPQAEPPDLHGTNIAKARRRAPGAITERVTALLAGTANPKTRPL